MESLGVPKTYDGREFWRNAAGAGRYVNSICQKQTIKAKNKSCREFLHLRYSWLVCMQRWFEWRKEKKLEKKMKRRKLKRLAVHVVADNNNLLAYMQLTLKLKS